MPGRVAAVVAGLVWVAAAGLRASERDYSKEAYVIEKLSVEIAVAADGTLEQDQSAVIRVQSETGVRQLGVLRLVYRSENERIELIYVRVRKPDGTVVETPRESVQDVPSETAKQAPTYSDLREKQVPVKGLAAGDVLEYSVRLVRTKAVVEGQFWYCSNFVKEAVVLDETLRLSFPADKYVKVKSTTVQPKVREEGGRKIYLWKTAQLESTAQRTAKRKVFRMAEIPAVQATTFESWDEVGRWFGGLVRSRAVVTPAIQAKADELTKGLASDSEKQRAIYRYVSLRFRYISIAFGLGRYQPHSAEEVLSNQYGDCKDKHTLMAALSKAAGMEAWPALMASGGKIDPDVPSPEQFDHVVTVLPRGQRFVWVDTTPEVAPYGVLAPELRDKQALVIGDKGAAALMITPADPPSPELDRFELTAALDGEGTLTGHFDANLQGDAAVALRSAFRQTPPAQWLELAQSMTRPAGSSGAVSNLDVGDLEDPEKPFHYSYDYVRKNYPNWTQKEVLPPLPPYVFPVAESDEKPAEPVFVAPVGEIICRGTLRLPEGYSAEAPREAKLEMAVLGYTSSYAAGKGMLTAERHLRQKKSKLLPEEWAEYVRETKSITEDASQFFRLSKGGNSEARALVVQGYADLRARRLEEAKQDFEKAEALNPRQASLWRGYALVYMTLRQLPEARKAAEKEIEIHPEDKESYRLLASILAMSHLPDEAMEPLRRLLRMDPADTRAANHLWNLLNFMKRHAEALEVAQATLKEVPNDRTLEPHLGESLLRLGRKEEGIVVLRGFVARNSGNPYLNDAAYILADTNTDLALAKEWANKAGSIEEQTKMVTLDALTDQDLARMRGLDDYWDTLGWIYFRAGEDAKAETFLRAAWMLGQKATIGDHLGQILEHRGNLEGARRAYELALARDQGFYETRERLKRLHATGAAATEQELGKLLSTGVPGLPERNAIAEFFVLFSPGKIEDVRFIGGNAELKDAGAVLKKAQFDVPFPQGSAAKLVRRGILSCSPETSPHCHFDLVLPSEAKK